MRQCYAATQDANSCTFCGNDRHKVNASDEGFVREICSIASGGAVECSIAYYPQKNALAPSLRFGHLYARSEHIQPSLKSAPKGTSSFSLFSFFCFLRSPTGVDSYRSRIPQLSRWLSFEEFRERLA
jgi:hypothetical protein